MVQVIIDHNGQILGANLVLPVNSLADLYAPGNISHVVDFATNCYAWARSKDPSGEPVESYVSTLRAYNRDDVNRYLIQHTVTQFLIHSKPGSQHFVWEAGSVMVSLFVPRLSTGQQLIDSNAGCSNSCKTIGQHHLSLVLLQYWLGVVLIRNVQQTFFHIKLVVPPWKCAFTRYRGLTWKTRLTGDYNWWKRFRIATVELFFFFRINTSTLPHQKNVFTDYGTNDYVPISVVDGDFLFSDSLPHQSCDSKLTQVPGSWLLTSFFFLSLSLPLALSKRCGLHKLKGVILP